MPIFIVNRDKSLAVFDGKPLRFIADGVDDLDGCELCFFYCGDVSECQCSLSRDGLRPQYCAGSRKDGLYGYWEGAGA